MKKDISGQGLLMSFFVRTRRQKKADAVADGHLLRGKRYCKEVSSLVFLRRRELKNWRRR